MRKIALVILSVFVVTGVVFASRTPEGRIPYPEDYDTETDGASAVAGIGNSVPSRYFAHPDLYNMKSGGPLVLLERFRTYQQTTEWSCGNASALMVLYHFGETGYRELDSVKIMGTQPGSVNGIEEEGAVYGTTTEGMVRFFEEIGYDVRSRLDRAEGDVFASVEEFREWVLQNLRANVPIMVEWLDWTAHWQVIIGYDTLGTDTTYDDVLILADPYDVGDHLQDGYYLFPAERFFYMWRDIRYETGSAATQQWVTAMPRKR